MGTWIKGDMEARTKIAEFPWISRGCGGYGWPQSLQMCLETVPELLAPTTHKAELDDKRGVLGAYEQPRTNTNLLSSYYLLLAWLLWRPKHVSRARHELRFPYGHPFSVLQMNPSCMAPKRAEQVNNDSNGTMMEVAHRFPVSNVSQPELECSLQSRRNSSGGWHDLTGRRNHWIEIAEGLFFRVCWLWMIMITHQVGKDRKDRTEPNRTDRQW